MTHILYACLLFGASLLACHRWVGVRGFFASRTILHAAMLLGGGIIVAYSATILFYFIYPGYIDHIQSTVASVSWLAVHGQPIYPDWHTQDVYGMLYGPLVYIVNGVFLLLSPTIWMSKLPGIMAFILTLPILWFALRRARTDGAIIFLLLSAFTLGTASQDFYAYSNRTDSFLILVAALMLLPLFMPRYHAMSVTGLLAGIAIGFKLHAAIYALPTALMLLVNEENSDRRLRMAALGMVTALAAIILPFVLSPTPMLDSYMQYLSVASHHGIGHADMMDSAFFALILALPMITLFLLRYPVLDNAGKVFLVGLAAAFVLTFLVSCKTGAGPHHFLPFLPAYIYGIALLIKAPVGRRRFLADHALIVFFFMFFAALFGMATYDGVRRNLYLLDTAEGEEAKIADLQKLIAIYPHAPVGVSDGAHYKDSDYRVLAVFQGAPLPIDTPVWMDLAFGGVDEDVLTRFITGCRITIWILPRAPAFSMVSWYTMQPLFSDRFRAQFHNNYTTAQTGAYYQAWKCKGT